MSFVVHEAMEDEDIEIYPINEMRNLAVRNVDDNSEFALILDVDMWPSYETYPALLTALHGLLGKTKVALVVPPFAFAGKMFENPNYGCRVTAKDVDEAKRYDSRIPKTHEDLRDCYVFDTSTFPRWHNFHDPKLWVVPHPNETTGLWDTYCGVFDRFNDRGHSATDIPAWWDQEPGSVRRIPCINSMKYEPYVVVRTGEMKGIPFNEDMKGYGKNKVGFMEALWVGGFSFYAAGGAFIFHHPHVQSPSKTLWRDHTNEEGGRMKERNNELYGEMIQRATSRAQQGTIVTPCCKTWSTISSALILGTTPDPEDKMPTWCDVYPSQ